MPWDALAFNGLKGCVCGCGADANQSWEEIDHKKYLEQLELPSKEK